MRALCEVLALLAPGEVALDPVEMQRRLDRPARKPLAGDLVGTSAQIARDGSWLTSGGAPGSVLFRTLIRRSGRHDFTFQLRGGPHVVSFGAIETRTLPQGDGEHVAHVSGVFLASGWLDIAVSMNPGGALGRVVAVPEALSPVAPIHGWRPKETLTYGAIATTIVRLGSWEEELPPHENGLATLPVMAGYDGGSIASRRVRIAESGVYSIAARVSGVLPSSVNLDGALVFPRPGIRGVTPADSSRNGVLVTLATIALDKGDHQLEFGIEPGGSVKELLHLQRKGTEDDCMQVALAHGFPVVAAHDEHAALRRERHVPRQVTGAVDGQAEFGRPVAHDDHLRVVRVADGEAGGEIPQRLIGARSPELEQKGDAARAVDSKGLEANVAALRHWRNGSLLQQVARKQPPQRTPPHQPPPISPLVLE